MLRPNGSNWRLARCSLRSINTNKKMSFNNGFRGRTENEMEDTFCEFKDPNSVFNENRPKAKRLSELKLGLSTSKKNQFRPIVSSAKKFSVMRPNFSQNMSTSKKISVQKRNSLCGIKRAIDFSKLQNSNQDIINSDNYIQRNNTLSSIKENSLNIKEKSSNNYPRKSIYPTFSDTRNLVQNTIVNDSHYLRQPLPEPSLSKTPKSAYKRTPISMQKSKLSPKIHNQTKNSPTPKKVESKHKSKSESKSTEKRKPLQALRVEPDMDLSDSSSSSDKENGDEVSNMKNLISKNWVSCRRILDSYDNVIVPESTSDSEQLNILMQNNFKIISQIMKQSMELLENNMKLVSLAMANKPYKNLPSSDNILKESTKKYTNNVANTSDDKIKDTDLRRKALENNLKLKENSSDNKLKKSRLMYASMKSEMSFLKTPRGDGGFGDSHDTPNSRCRTEVAKNLQNQLEMLLDD